MIDQLQGFVDGLPMALQILITMGIGAIPFLESYGAAAIGVVAGVPTPVAIIAAILGNLICSAVVIFLAIRARAAISSKRTPAPMTPRRMKLKRALDRYGVPGVTMIGPLIIANLISAPALIGLGADRNQVIIWQVISVTVWGIAFGVLASLGVSFLV